MNPFLRFLLLPVTLTIAVGGWLWILGRFWFWRLVRSAFALALPAMAQLPPPPHPPCTNCPVAPLVNGLTNDPLLTFDSARRVPFSASYQLNTWQWWTAADTNAIEVFDGAGQPLPALAEANGTHHASLMAAWALQGHASNTPVAVIDQGLHGAQVASLIAAPAGDGLGLAGTARRVPLLVMPSHYGAGQVSSLIAEAVTAGARTINMSFGYVDATAPASVLEAMATNTGTLFVLAALNGLGPEDNSRDWLCLARLPNAICVSAVTKSGDLFGAYGTNVTIAAPGRRVVVDDHSFPFPEPAALKGGKGEEETWGEARGFWSVTGTSFATAIVSGAAALLRERYPDETPEQIIERLCLGAEPMAHPLYTTRCGTLNVFRALTWCRVPELRIGHGVLLVGGPAGSVSTVLESAEPAGPWTVAFTATNTGWPNAWPVTMTNQHFWRLV